MKNKLISFFFILISIGIVQRVFAQSIQTFTEQALFENGTYGYECYRIPAIITAPNGDLLAFAEGRLTGCNDFGNVDLLLRISNDNGQSWSKQKVVADYGDLQAGNPAPVVDAFDPAYPNGRIFLFYNTGTASEHETRKGNGIREVWYTTSLDNGITWSETTNITPYVHKLNRPKENPAYHFKEDWRTNAVTPGHALQLTNGTYKGRLFIPANHSFGEPQKGFYDYRAYAFYTDDHAKTWKISEEIDIPSSNESIAAQLSDGRVMQNIRQQSGESKNRIVAISEDGGAKWDSIYFDTQLPSPVCQASIINYTTKDGQKTLLFSNPNSTEKREKMTVRVSFDDGITWPVSRLIRASGAAYSDLVIVGNGEIGLLYEHGNGGGIHYAGFNEEWLMGDWDKKK